MAIERILIANRGEIALRAIRTIKEMGKQAICIYSTADENALYLKYADASICIGDVKSVQSYLNIPAIMAAAEISECDAIFPGYGFLSENQNFVEICNHHKISFIGPRVETMIALSDKAKAKEIMKKAGIPVIPGSEGALNSAEEAKELAQKIGYPVILKASAGGGGRGMRVVKNKQEIEKAYMAAESEAYISFNDRALYMEKYIEKPRHIEVQIIADKHGNAIHIGERDCSMQRRHQKLIEESPALFLDKKTRQKLLDTAIKATKAIKYENAGTFEFLVDEDRNFYFMEMNTRLQVEHCVSEMVGGIDIIEWMIRVSEGDKLPSQESIVLNGHAIECRITAEDPKSFIPNPGKITKFIAPGGRNIRFDSHIYQGYSVPPYYDSMIGKLIVLGKNRKHAIIKMKYALKELDIQGIKVITPFHIKMMENEDFINNEYNTKYLENY